MCQVVWTDWLQLLLNHQNVIAPDPRDPLHELLDDLGDVCDVGALLGELNVMLIIQSLELYLNDGIVINISYYKVMLDS